eukprot:4974805-Heterocapsa_arctica.AAC.1
MDTMQMDLEWYTVGVVEDALEELHAFENQLGVQAPMGVWDPDAFATIISKDFQDDLISTPWGDWATAAAALTRLLEVTGGYRTLPEGCPEAPETRPCP